jgi:hypothetical protein
LIFWVIASTLTVNCVPLCKASTACSNVLVGFMSKEWMKIDSESTFSGGSFGYTVGCAIRSVMKVALTGYGYSYLSISI